MLYCCHRHGLEILHQNLHSPYEAYINERTAAIASERYVEFLNPSKFLDLEGTLQGHVSLEFQTLLNHSIPDVLR